MLKIPREIQRFIHLEQMNDELPNQGAVTLWQRFRSAAMSLSAALVQLAAQKPEKRGQIQGAA